MMKFTKKATTTKLTGQLAAEDLLKLLKIPTTAQEVKIYVNEPGGGDWSNTKLTIDKSCSIIIEWIELS